MTLLSRFLTSMGRSRRRRPRSRGVPSQPVTLAGFTLLEVLIVVAIILIIFAITMPRIAPLLQTTHKTTVVANLQTVNNELSAYRMICGSYPERLDVLKDSAEKGCSSNSGVHSGPMIAHGYRISYTATRPDENGVYSGYTLTADPFSSGTAGIQSYFTDQTGIIRMHSGGRADASDPPLSP